MLSGYAREGQVIFVIFFRGDGDWGGGYAQASGEGTWKVRREYVFLTCFNIER